MSRGRRLIGALLAWLAPSLSPSWAGTGTPEALLADVYGRYAAQGGPGMPGEPAALAGLMEPGLAAAWARNGRAGATSRSLDDVIDYDPFVGGQDFELSGLVIGRPALAGRCAAATVSFRNFGEPRRVRYDLVRGPGGWRIADLHSADTKSLRARLRLPGLRPACP